jgi:hypothetical protein
MTRTAVRRRVDVNDGRLVIRKVVVETSECLDAGPIVEPVVENVAPAAAEASATGERRFRRPERLRGLRPGKYSVRIRRFHLL